MHEMEKNFKHGSPVAPVPTFLQKLVALLEEEENHPYVNWNNEGTSFIVKDQNMFSKEVLPKYFKHSNFASFVRQLNMYGFRKLTNITHSGLRYENDGIEFQHYLFVRGQDFLLEHIKRKVNSKGEDVAKTELTKVIGDVQKIKESQDEIAGHFSELRQENEDLWREVVSLRQKHAQQQRVINKVIQFLVSLVQQRKVADSPNTRKRKIPLMIENSVGPIVYKLPRKQNKLVSGQIPVLEHTGTTVLPSSGVKISEILNPRSSGDTAVQNNQPQAYIVTSPSSGTNVEVVNDGVAQSPQDSINNSTIGATNINVSPNIPIVNQSLNTNVNETSTNSTIDVDEYLNTIINNPEPENVNTQNMPNMNTSQNTINNQFQYNTTMSSPEVATNVSTLYDNPQTTNTGFQSEKSSNTTLSSGSNVKLNLKLPSQDVKDKQVLQYKPSPPIKLIEPDILESRLENVQGNLNTLQDLLASPSGVNLDFSMLQDLFNPNGDPTETDYSATLSDNSTASTSASSGPLVLRNDEPTQSDLDELAELL